MRVLSVLTLAVLLSLPGYAQGPDPKEHTYNPDLPEQLEGEMIPLATRGGLAFRAYEVKSKQPSETGILLIHEWWGLNGHMKATADQFALLGYNALAVDLYGEKSTDNPEEAGKLMEAVNSDEALRKLETALEYFSLSNKKIAVIGWCFGGGWALKLSLARPELVSATVIYYGELNSDPTRLAKLQGPVLGIFAKKDGWITPQLVEAFKVGLEQAGIPHEIYTYDADHAFANPSGKHFDESAYKDAWAKTLEFLGKTLHNTAEGEK